MTIRNSLLIGITYGMLLATALTFSISFVEAFNSEVMQVCHPINTVNEAYLEIGILALMWGMVVLTAPLFIKKLLK